VPVAPKQNKEVADPRAAPPAAARGPECGYGATRGRSGGVGGAGCRWNLGTGGGATHLALSRKHLSATPLGGCFAAVLQAVLVVLPLLLGRKRVSA
jgi:hypothetical protein